MVFLLSSYKDKKSIYPEQTPNSSFLSRFISIAYKYLPMTKRIQLGISNRSLSLSKQVGLHQFTSTTFPFLVKNFCGFNHIILRVRSSSRSSRITNSNAATICK